MSSSSVRHPASKCKTHEIGRPMASDCRVTSRMDFAGYSTAASWNTAARVVCPSCQYEILVPFSCKVRGLCPPCDGRRMAAGAADLVDHILPVVADYRQWTSSLPRWLRIRLLRDKALVSEVLLVFVHVVAAYHRLPKGLTGHVMDLVDGFHVAEYVQQAADAIEGPGSPAARILAATWRETLKAERDGPATVLRSMRARSASVEFKTRQKAPATALQYIANQNEAGRMNYAGRPATQLSHRHWHHRGGGQDDRRHADEARRFAILSARRPDRHDISRRRAVGPLRSTPRNPTLRVHAARSGCGLSAQAGYAPVATPLVSVGCSS